MDQTTEQTTQPEVTQTTTTLTAEPTQTTAPETPAVDFQSLIPEEYKEEKSLQNFNKMDDFVKSYLHSQKMVGLDKIPVPNKHATEDDWKEVYKRLGSPEAADGYKYSLPEGHAVPEDTLKSFSDTVVATSFNTLAILTSPKVIFLRVDSVHIGLGLDGLSPRFILATDSSMFCSVASLIVGLSGRKAAFSLLSNDGASTKGSF